MTSVNPRGHLLIIRHQDFPILFPCISVICTMTLDIRDVLDIVLNCDAHDLFNISDSCVLRNVNEARDVREDPFSPVSSNMQIISVIWGMS